MTLPPTMACRATELRNGTKKCPGWVWGLPGHLWHRMLVVGFDRRGDVTKLRLTSV
jgi:hypothetical protein